MFYTCRTKLKSNFCIQFVRKLCEESSQLHLKSKYDVVIIGGGHNGLVAAAYLAKAGAKVCVLERRYLLGGAAVTEEIIPGFKFSRASYVLSLLRPQIYSDLNLKEHGLKVYLRDPYSYTPLREHFWKSTQAKSLTLSRNHLKNQEEIAKFSNKDAQVYQKYEELLSRLVDAVEPLMDISPHSLMNTLDQPSAWGKTLSAWNNSSNLTELVKIVFKMGKDIRPLYELMTASPKKVLNRWFESEPLRATLATDALIGTMACTDTPGVGYVLLHHVMGGVEGVKGAWAYPEGGMGAVSAAIATSARSFGAELYTDQMVTAIKTDSSGAAVGVVTSSGIEVDARLVLSNATPAATLSLLPPGTLSEETTSALQAIQYESPVTKINVALSRIPQFLANPTASSDRVMPHHHATIHLNCENCDIVDEAYRDAQRGVLPTRPMIEMVLPSSLDPTLAPPGAHVCLLFTQFTPYHLAGGRVWDTMVREEYAQMVFDCIEEYAPGFKSSVVGKEVLAPPDLEHIFGLSGGNIFHGAMTMDQIFLSRPLASGSASPMTPVERLLLCGSGAHPGGGVTGAPGRLAALEAINMLKL
ncbi:pyridine nucleotide-disulfide oxidoreductase domain-containing protein 2-like [Homalodisca vitripennis]|nr:pyridine nucleotide-disulfide oxidoreductase domain-containing protein 2-like [Homalodisca vitripennis]